MAKMNLTVRNLDLMPHHLTRAGDSDGLHLGSDAKNLLFGRIIDEGLRMHRGSPPVVTEVGLILEPETRNAIVQMRRHKRLLKKTRVAEKEIYKQVEKEKSLKKTGSTVSEA